MIRVYKVGKKLKLPFTVSYTDIKVKSTETVNLFPSSKYPANTDNKTKVEVK